MIDTTLSPDQYRENPAEQDELTCLAWYRLRLLGLGHAAGWYEYAAGNHRWSLLRLREEPGTGGPFTRWREIFRNEGPGWIFGIADAANDEHTPDAFALQATLADTPYLMTAVEVAAALGISEGTVDRRFLARHLYPVFVQRRTAERYAPWPQIADQLDLPGWPTEWDQVRRTLPPLNRIEDQTTYLGPQPSPNPLPYRNTQRIGQQMEALAIADAEGWISYVHGDPRGPGLYTIEVPSGNTRRIPGHYVLPYVLGLADWHGHPDLVAYRDNLG